MKTLKTLLKLCFFLIPAILFAQIGEKPQKFALVMGNGAYTGGLTRLSNPVNDANDVTSVLEHLGFTVHKLLNANLEQMEDAIIELKTKLAEAENAYGFFFYAGHGVQSGGDNYLIPVNVNIPSENSLRSRAVSVQMLLDELNDAGNGLNVVVLDACRDNPFGWSRSGSRGLSIVNRQPADSIIVYATSAGQRASDGEGRNGVFTSQLLNNLATPGLEVKEVFNRTGNDVARVSDNNQIPAIYSQFFGTAFLGEAPADYLGQVIVPGTTVIIGRQAKEPEATKFWSVGASLGSSFAAPWLMGTVYGTISPLKYSFLELGVDIGFVDAKPDVGYYSIYPFAHYAYFWPFTEKIGIYAGAGGGIYYVSYKIKGLDNYSENFFAAGLTTGLKLFNMLSVSYTLRTNFKGISNKASVGYCYRFR